MRSQRPTLAGRPGVSEGDLLMLAPWIAVGVGLAAIGYNLLSARGDRYGRRRQAGWDRPDGWSSTLSPRDQVGSLGQQARSRPRK
jgi:hypothetical protein